MKDRIAFVTGAGGGIGREIAISLAKQKVNIVLFGGKDAEKLQSTAEMVRAFGVKTWVYPGDLTDDKVLNDNFDFDFIVRRYFGMSDEDLKLNQRYKDEKKLKNEGYKQEDIAKILDCKQSAISKYELRRSKYKIEDLIKLCLFYNVSADYILGLPEDLPYPKR